MCPAHVLGPVSPITDLHQVTLPEEVLEYLRIVPGDCIEFFPLSVGRYMIYVSGRRQSMEGIFPKPKRVVSDKEINRFLQGKKMPKGKRK